MIDKKILESIDNTKVKISYKTLKSLLEDEKELEKCKDFKADLIRVLWNGTEYSSIIPGDNYDARTTYISEERLKIFIKELFDVFKSWEISNGLQILKF